MMIGGDGDTRWSKCGDDGTDSKRGFCRIHTNPSAGRRYHLQDTTEHNDIELDWTFNSTKFDKESVATDWHA